MSIGNAHSYANSNTIGDTDANTNSDRDTYTSIGGRRLQPR